MIRIGHKGADALVPGNTVASFEKAVEIGVDLIEFDVLRTDGDEAGVRSRPRPPLIVAHDPEAAAAARAPSLDEALAAFSRPPLDRVRINLDLKLPGREDEIVSALRNHGLTARASVSTMEISTLEAIRELEPDLPRGWTVPRVTRDWTSNRWLGPALTAGAAFFRRRLPGSVRTGVPRLQADAVWAFHGIVTPRLVEAVHAADARLNVWTVDDAALIARYRAMGVDGICSNDPRLLQG